MFKKVRMDVHFHLNLHVAVYALNIFDTVGCAVGTM